MNEDAKIHDPRNLIGDALIMEGLTVEENRSIFFDWAFGLKQPETAPASARALLDVYRTEETAAHPMVLLLEQAANGPATKRGRTNRRREAAKRWEISPNG
jgi:hypothetical protein